MMGGGVPPLEPRPATREQPGDSFAARWRSQDSGDQIKVLLIACNLKSHTHFQPYRPETSRKEMGPELLARYLLSKIC